MALFAFKKPVADDRRAPPLTAAEQHLDDLKAQIVGLDASRTETSAQYDRARGPLVEATNLRAELATLRETRRDRATAAIVDGAAVDLASLDARRRAAEDRLAAISDDVDAASNAETRLLARTAEISQEIERAQKALPAAKDRVLRERLAVAAVEFETAQRAYIAAHVHAAGIARAVSENRGSPTGINSRDCDLLDLPRPLCREFDACPPRRSVAAEIRAEAAKVLAELK